MEKTVLNERHRALGAKMVEFSGWEMPISYERGILAEHREVRERVGIFDLSHMGKIDITGPAAEKFLDYLSTNRILRKPDNSATYTVWMHEAGGSVDDLIVYRHHAEHFFVVVNAANRQKDLDHLQRQALNWDVKILPRFAEEGIVAIQGPQATAVVSSLFPQAQLLKSMHFQQVAYEDISAILAATGYTGAGGVELIVPLRHLPALWDYFVVQQKVMPIGLGARDTLRLEMGYALYGHELSETISPSESVSAWTVKMTKEDFLGKTALQQLEQSGRKRFAYGIQLLSPGIAREGCTVFYQDQPIGTVTSGTFSPSLNCAIALLLVNQPLKEGARVFVTVRNQMLPAHIVKLPFIN
jgi:aminomethyltransferase